MKAVEIFLDNHLHWADSTRTAYQTILECFIKRNEFESKFLTHITSNDISRYLMRNDISNATRKKEYRHLKHFWRWCVDKHWVKNSPMKGVVLPRETPNTIGKMIKPDELMKLFEA
ncbi:MAG TPA: phage integrase SAM-like domain-containing protein, partial [Balneolales bacterium]|nr:phage integrase SAM-like domain-containing protein [Balneolales bacterium]